MESPIERARKNRPKEVSADGPLTGTGVGRQGRTSPDGIARRLDVFDLLKINMLARRARRGNVNRPTVTRNGSSYNRVSQSTASEEAMNYASSAAERAVLIVDRLLIAAMTSAWTSTLRHWHALPAQDERCCTSDVFPSHKASSAPDDQFH